MALAKKQCRVCGKPYEACRSAKKINGSFFYWRDVACSLECGSIYLAQISASRNITPATSAAEVSDDKKSKGGKVRGKKTEPTDIKPDVVAAESDPERGEEIPATDTEACTY